MQKNEPPSPQAPQATQEIRELCQKLEKEKNPNKKDVDRLYKLMASTPAYWAFASDTQAIIRNNLIEKMSDAKSYSQMRTEAEILANRLGHESASSLERLLIEQIVLARFRALHAEHNYNNRVLGQSLTFREGEYWDNLLTSTQARFLRAIETLARVRRLARNTPALQINISNECGNQLNAQPEVNDKRDTPLARSLAAN